MTHTAPAAASTALAAMTPGTTGRRYYTGADPVGYYPFNRVNTCPIFIIPNFGTLDWDKPKPTAVERSMRQLDDDDGATCDDLMLYIHVPFCRSYCHYCNFARDRFPWHDQSVLDQYTEYLLREIDFYLNEVPYVRSRHISAWYYATVKYNEHGAEEWVALYNGPGDGGGNAKCMALDGSGNVYISGSSLGIGTDDDYATIKYPALFG